MASPRIWRTGQGIWCQADAVFLKTIPRGAAGSAVMSGAGRTSGPKVTTRPDSRPLLHKIRLLRRPPVADLLGGMRAVGRQARAESEAEMGGLLIYQGQPAGAHLGRRRLSGQLRIRRHVRL